MSRPFPSPEQSSPATSPAAAQPPKAQRVLACVLCQQRKVKCDRKFPCANCIKSRAQCVPGTLAPRRRRRRFPEGVLLERVRKYEDLLRQHNIKFEPLRKDISEAKESPNADGVDDSDDEPLETASGDPSTTAAQSDGRHESKNFWHAVSYALRDRNNDSDSSDEDVREIVIKKAWNQFWENDDHLLFNLPKTNLDLSTLHPEPVQIFRLWQVYLDNINPIFKVTHTPTLQGRIIEATSNMSNITPTLEALMFSIYCISVLSLDEDDCQSMFSSSKEDLLMRYHIGCQQALSKCRFLRSDDRDSLTALYLYLVSVGLKTVPQSISSLLGVAIRIAQRMGIHREAANAKCTVLEAEMRRRLWWCLILFDARIGELAYCENGTLVPTWDCKVPLNVNDSDLRPEMKEPPVVQGKLSEALFAVVRSELGDFIRYSKIHLDFGYSTVNSAPKQVLHSSAPGDSDLTTVEKMITDKYLKSCDPENPLHLMAICTTRATIAKYHLVEHYSKFSSPSAEPTESQRDLALSYSFTRLECDTKIMTSVLTKGYRWMVYFYFPFPAYIHIVQDLKLRPISKQAEHAWEVMSDNFEARFIPPYRRDNPFFEIFAKVLLQAWEAREQALGQQAEPLMQQPRIVTHIKNKLAEIAGNAQGTNLEHPIDVMSMGIDESSMNMPMSLDNRRLLNGMGWQGPYAGIWPSTPQNMPGQPPFDIYLNQLWTAMDWSSANAPTASSASATGPFTWASNN